MKRSLMFLPLMIFSGCACPQFVTRREFRVAMERIEQRDHLMSALAAQKITYEEFLALDRMQKRSYESILLTGEQP